MIYTASILTSAENENILEKFISYLAENFHMLGEEMGSKGKVLSDLYAEGFTFSIEKKTFSEIYQIIKREFKELI